MALTRIISEIIEDNTIQDTDVSSSFQASISGSFGNQRVGTTDDVQFNHITASGNISSSGTVIADNFQSTGGSVDGISFTDDLNITGNITASGAISSSVGSFTTVDIDGGSITGITDLAVADGGTGVSSLTDGGVLLGSGTSGITAMSALGDSEMIVGDGSGDPVAESGATLRTSIGVGTTDDVKFANITGSTLSASSAEFTSDLAVTGNITGSSVSASVSEFTTATIDKIGGAIDFNNENMTNVDIDSGTITGITDLAVADGGTGVSTLTDGGVLLGSGTSGITAMSVLGDSEMIVGDGSTDPVAESGTTLRTSIGVGTTDNVVFSNVSGAAATFNSATVKGTLTAEEVHTTFISSSVAVSTGSNVFGDATSDLQELTGSVDISGSLRVSDSSTSVFTGNVTVESDLISTTTNGVISGSISSTGSFASYVVASDRGVKSSYSFTGDTDSGIHGTGGGNIMITTNGTEAIRFDASQNVGIGTNGPDGTLHTHTGTAGSITANANADDLVVENSNHGGISILTPNDKSGIIYWGAPASNLEAQLYYDHNGQEMKLGTNDSGGHLVFSTDSNTERMRILSGGNVGIGIASPTKPLQVTGDISGSGDIYGNDRLYLGTKMALDVNGTIIYLGSTTSANDNSAIYFRTDDANRMVVSSSGEVGIGVDTPTNFLHLKADSHYPLKVEGTNSKGAGINFVPDNGDDLSFVIDATGFSVYNDTTSKYLTTISGSGLVGIGTTGPTAQLHIDGTGAGGDGTLFIERASAGYGLKITAAEATSHTTIETIGSGTGNAELIFGTQETERMRIDAAGLVGIGTNNPVALLHVSQSGADDNDVGLLIETTNTSERARMELKHPSAGRNYSMNLNSSGLHFGDTSTLETLNVSGSSVGIGITSPERKFHVTEAAGVTYVRLGNNISDPAVLEFESARSPGSSAQQSVGEIRWSNDNFSNEVASIVAYKGGSDVDDALAVDFNGTEQFRIESDGLVSGSSTSTGSFGGGGVRIGHIGRTGKLYIAGDGTPYASSAEYFTLESEGDRGLDLRSQSVIRMYVDDGNDLALTLAANNRITMGGADGNQLTINDGGSTNSVIQFQQADSAKAMVGWDNTNTVLKLNGTTSAFANNNHLVINASGKVGIGVSNPGYNLVVSGSNEVAKFMSDDTDNKLSVSWGVATEQQFVYMATRSSISGTGSDPSFGIYTDVNNTFPGSCFHLGIPGGSSIAMTVSGSTGFIGMGTVKPTHQLDVEDANTTVASFNRAGSSGEVILIQDDGSTVAELRTDQTYNYTSDYRLKENIEDLEIDALARVNVLKPRTFNFKKTPDIGKEGFIAHEVEEVIPKAVKYEKDGEDDEGNPKYQMMNDGAIIPTLVKSIQELTQAHRDLRASITGSTDINQLKALVSGSTFV